MSTRQGKAVQVTPKTGMKMRKKKETCRSVLDIEKKERESNKEEEDACCGWT